MTAATALAFFAMVGFEDSVNMAEETKDPVKIFPKIMLIGLCITGVIYVPGRDLGGRAGLAGGAQRGRRAAARRWSRPAHRTSRSEIFALITMFAVANSALINMLMASRLLYGMSHEQVLPGPLGRVLHTRRTPWVGDHLHHRCSPSS